MKSSNEIIQCFYIMFNIELQTFSLQVKSWVYTKFIV